MGGSQIHGTWVGVQSPRLLDGWSLGQARRKALRGDGRPPNVNMVSSADPLVPDLLAPGPLIPRDSGAAARTDQHGCMTDNGAV